jgi:hypothetical protein
MGEPGFYSAPVNLAKTPPLSLLLFVFRQSVLHCKKSILLTYTFCLLRTFASRSRIHERTMSLGFLNIILMFPYTMLTLQTSFKKPFARGGGE